MCLEVEIFAFWYILLINSDLRNFINLYSKIHLFIIQLWNILQKVCVFFYPEWFHIQREILVLINFPMWLI